MKVRHLLAACSLLLVILPDAAVADQASAPFGPVPLPETGAYLGAYVDVDAHTGTDRGTAFETFESLETGRRLDLERVFYFWNEQFPTAEDYASRDKGRTLILSWSAARNTGSWTKWGDIAAGLYDDVIDEKAAAIKAFEAPLFFSFNHEPENDDVATKGGTAEEFVAAWQHIHDRFIAKGVTNVSWTLIMMAWTYERDLNPDDFWPGDAYVDVFSADGYNWFNCLGHLGPWRGVEEIFEDWYAYGLEHSKPMLVAEYGSGEDPANPGRKGAWLAEAATVFKSWPEVKGVTYYNSAPTASCARWIDTSASSVSAFKAMGADPYFNPSPIVNVVSGPEELTEERSASFEFSSSVAGSSFTCSLDDGPSVPCTTPETYAGLAEGPHEFSINATAPDGTVGTTTKHHWTVSDLVVHIDSGPAAQTGDQFATFTFSATKPAMFSCSLDGGAFAPCTSPKSYSGLLKASHTFAVQGNDGEGRIQTASWTWRIFQVGAEIGVADFKFSPQSATTSQGRPPRWTFTGPSAHTATDTSGMGLFDSGSRSAGSKFVFNLTAAGIYPYACQFHPSMTGTVGVSLKVSPASGNVNTRFTITWATAPSPPGYVHDIQIRRPGGSNWATFATGQAIISGRFTPDRGPGTYSFRARLSNSINGETAEYGTPVSIIVT